MARWAIWNRVSTPGSTPPSTLRVVPTARVRREKLAASSGLSDPILTMAEFEARLVVLPKRALIDETTRLLLLREAASDPIFKELGIAPDFLVFLEHGPFFLRFFEELALEGVEPQALLEGDSYAEYGEHITLLATLKERYLALLAREQLADRILQSSDYTLNSAYLEAFEAVEIEVEGYLSRFERTLLERVAALCPLTLRLHLTPFDQKMAEAFAPFGPATGHLNTLDLSRKTPLKRTPLAVPEAFHLYSLPNRLAQCGALLDTIYRLVDEGVAPERIAVVLPDESLAPFLHRFDRHRIFNFAMGLPLSEEPLYLTLEGLYAHLCSPGAETQARFERLMQQHPVLGDIYRTLATSQPHKADWLLEQLHTLSALASSPQTHEALTEALYQIKPLLEAADTLVPHQALYLLIGDLKTRRIDDVGGGPVTVLGVLETRGVGFEAVLVPDFNEGFAPKESVKDLFLSSAVRARAGLPTRADRADLQRSLYWRLFGRTPRRYIFCVQSDQAQPSRFIKELGIRHDATPYRFDPALLYPARGESPPEEEPIELKIDLTQRPLYPHQLKSYLTCRRQYYYRYLRKLRSPEALTPPSPARTFGVWIHEILKSLYSRSLPPRKLHERLSQALLKASGEDARMAIEARIWIKKLEAFCRHETERLEAGWRPYLLEEELHGEIEGVPIAGRIDRIDRREEALLVIDYKTGKLPTLSGNEKQSDFQLIFYALLGANQPHAQLEAAYYDLSEGVLEPLEDPTRQEAALRAQLQQFKAPLQRFDRCQSRTPCRHCDYATLCQRRV